MFEPSFEKVTLKFFFLIGLLLRLEKLHDPLSIELGPVKMLRMSEKTKFLNSPSTEKEIISVPRYQDTPINRNKLKITLNL